MFLGQGIRLQQPTFTFTGAIGDGWWISGDAFGWDFPSTETNPEINISGIVPGRKYQITGNVTTLTGSNPAVRVRLGSDAANTFSITSTGAFDETHVAASDNNLLRFIIDTNLTTDAVRIESFAIVHIFSPIIASSSISGSSYEAGSVLTAVADVSGSPTPAMTYQWKRGGSNISGATAATYTRLWSDFDKEISVQITATNSEGTATQTPVLPVAGVNTPPSYFFNSVENGGSYLFHAGAELGYLGVTNRSLGDQTIVEFGSFGIDTFRLVTPAKPTNGDTIEVYFPDLGTETFNWNGSHYIGSWPGLTAYLAARVGQWIEVGVGLFDYEAPVILQQIPTQTVSVGHVLRIPLNTYLSIPGDDPLWTRRTALEVDDMGGGNPTGGVFAGGVFEEGVFE